MVKVYFPMMRINNDFDKQTAASQSRRVKMTRTMDTSLQLIRTRWVVDKSAK